MNTTLESGEVISFSPDIIFNDGFDCTVHAIDLIRESVVTIDNLVSVAIFTLTLYYFFDLFAYDFIKDLILKKVSPDGQELALKILKRMLGYLEFSAYAYALIVLVLHFIQTGKPYLIISASCFIALSIWSIIKK